MTKLEKMEMVESIIGVVSRQVETILQIHDSSCPQSVFCQYVIRDLKKKGFTPDTAEVEEFMEYAITYFRSKIAQAKQDLLLRI